MQMIASDASDRAEFTRRHKRFNPPTTVLHDPILHPLVGGCKWRMNLLRRHVNSAQLEPFIFILF